MREENIIVIMLKSMSKSESIISSYESIIIPSVLITIVRYILANPMPANTFCVFEFIAKT